MEKIIFHKETKTFHLYNEEISYIMCVLENGHMGQLYYGKRIHDKPDFSYLVEKCGRPMTSLEQLRLYTELQRLTGSVDIDETEAGQSICGFEYNGKSISKFGDYVYVYKPEKVNKSYLLSYATKCRRKFFEDVMKDVADDTK